MKIVYQGIAGSYSEVVQSIFILVHKLFPVKLLMNVLKEPVQIAILKL